MLFHAYRTMFSPSQEAAAREEMARSEQTFARLPEHWREPETVHERSFSAARAPTRSRSHP